MAQSRPVHWQDVYQEIWVITMALIRNEYALELRFEGMGPKYKGDESMEGNDEMSSRHNNDV